MSTDTHNVVFFLIVLWRNDCIATHSAMLVYSFCKEPNFGGNERLTKKLLKYSEPLPHIKKNFDKFLRKNEYFFLSSIEIKSLSNRLSDNGI